MLATVAVSTGVAGKNVESADAVAVKAKILVAGISDERLVHRIENETHRRRVLVEAVAQALVGEIDEGDQFARGENLGDFLPLIRREAHAGRIVAAAVQQHDVARLRGAERVAHAVEIDFLRCEVDELVGLDRPHARP